MRLMAQNRLIAARHTITGYRIVAWERIWVLDLTKVAHGKKGNPLNGCVTHGSCCGGDKNDHLT